MSSRVTGAKMRLYLAVAVLMLAFVAHAGRSEQILFISYMCLCVFMCLFMWMSVACNFVRPSLWTAEAQDDPIEQTFSNIGDQMTELGTNMRERVSSWIETIQQSDLAVKSKYDTHIHAHTHTHTSECLSLCNFFTSLPQELVEGKVWGDEEGTWDIV